jgi:hypothetical protein
MHLSRRLLDQRLDEGFDLLALERLALGSVPRWRGRTSRGGNGDASHRCTIELMTNLGLESLELQRAPLRATG